MKVDFNSVRRGAVSSYNSLVKVLNDRKRGSGYVEVHCDEILGSLESLRRTIAVIALTYDPDQPGEFDDVLGDGILEVFEGE